MKFFPDFLLRDLFGWTLALALLATLAALFPWELGDKADPFAPAYRDIKPEWYFMFMFETLKLVPGGQIFGIDYEAVPILAFALAGVLLLLVPFLDRRLSDSGHSPLFTGVGVLAVIYMVGMTAWGYRSLVPVYIILLTAVVAFILSIGASRTPRR
jgi:quinol-cytochrome oxidoreductase complex cytochrome b subunit